MIARDNAERRQTEATALLEQARSLLQQNIAALSAALDDAERLTTEAQAIAKQFNQAEASAWVLEENCGLLFARIGRGDVRLLLHNIADIKMTPCTVEPGVLVKLGWDMQYKDCPRGGTVAISERECQRLERDFLVSRVKTPAEEESSLL